MTKDNQQKSENSIEKHLMDAKQKIEESKLLDRIEEFQKDLKIQIIHLQTEIREQVAKQSKQDELNTSILAKLHQIGEMLQKLEEAHQYTHRLVSQHQKHLDENRQLIHKIENEIQKIKSVLRVD